MAILQKVALFLTIIGALNWGCIGLFNFDPIATLFQGVDYIFTRGIYAIVGLAGLVNIALLFASTPEKQRSQEVPATTST